MPDRTEEETSAHAVAKPSCTWQLEVKVQSEKLKTTLGGKG
jgi:hypothetical protein